MNDIFLSKSGYCQCVQCEKIFWLNRYRNDVLESESDDSLFETGRQVGELAKGLFGKYEDVPYEKDFNLRLKKTNLLLQDKPNVITEASFIWNNNFCSVDILKNDADGVEIYEVKSSTEIKDIYYDDVAYQYFVLTRLGYNVKKACIVYINNEYVRSGELEIEKLFSVEDVTGEVKDKLDEIAGNLDSINEFMNSHDGQNEPEMELGIHCFKPYACKFWDYCTRNLAKPNVFDLKNMQNRTKFKKYYEGKISFEDLKSEDLNPKCLEQIDFELNNREAKIDVEVIRDFMAGLRYPLYFIDYESCNYAIPEYAGTKPYQQIPFQYSLHIIRHEGALLEHREFLAESDDENLIRNFAESMIRDMDEDGSVIVYNKGFEAGRNREIGEMYPDLKDEMERINSNIVDLMVPFRQRNYYTKEMKGSYSIKYVLPALYPDDPELDYLNLDVVHNGSEASNAFSALKDKTPEEQEKIRLGLLEYCKLDTLAMVKIWERFKEVIQ